MGVGAGRWGGTAGRRAARLLSYLRPSMASARARAGGARHGFGVDDGPARPAGRRARVTSWKRGASAQSPVGQGHWQRPARLSPCGPDWARRSGRWVRVPGAAWSCWPGAQRPRGWAWAPREAARAARRTVGARRGSGGVRAMRAPHVSPESQTHRRVRSAVPEGSRVQLEGSLRVALARLPEAEALGARGARGVGSPAPGAPQAGGPPAGRSSWPQPAAVSRWPT